MAKELDELVEAFRIRSQSGGENVHHATCRASAARFKQVDIAGMQRVAGECNLRESDLLAGLAEALPDSRFAGSFSVGYGGRYAPVRR